MSDTDPILSLVRPAVLALTPYSSARSEFKTDEARSKWTWLDANENPTTPSANSSVLNRYPDPQPRELIDRLAALYGISPAQLLITRGSDEGIDLLMRAFCHEGHDSIITTPPTYGMYSVAAAIQGARVVSVPLDRANNFALDDDAVIAAWKPGVKLVFLCSPNNPTGGLLDRAAVLRIARELLGKAVVVVDEAYLEFSGSRSLAAEIGATPNIAVLRTLSKAFGLAGARCGVTLGSPELIAVLRRIIAPYPVPAPVATAAIAALMSEGIAAARESSAALVAGRRELAAALSKLPVVKRVWPSDANFLLVEVTDSARVMAASRAASLVIRDRSREQGLENCVRITAGTPAENQLVVETLSHVA